MISISYLITLPLDIFAVCVPNTLHCLRNLTWRSIITIYLSLNTANSWLSGTKIISTFLLLTYGIISIEVSSLNSRWEIRKFCIIYT